METRSQNNHTVAARALSDRFPQMSLERSQTGENVISLNKYKHNYSREQHIAQSALKANFYEDEYKKMVSRMDKVVIAKNRKTDDPFGELLQISVLADGGYVDSQTHIPSPQWKRKSKVSIHSLLKWNRHQDEKHEMFMAMITKLEDLDKEWFRRKLLQRKERLCRMPPGDFMIDTPAKETDDTKESNEGNYGMSGGTSEGDSSMDSMLFGDSMGSSGPEEDVRIGITQGEDFKIGCVSGQSFPEKEVKSVPEKEVKSVFTKKVSKSTSKKDKAAVCRHFAKGWCRQGEACSFLHSVKDSYPNNQKVFLGGLPHSITPSKLLQELEQQGYRVINEPKIFRGFSPQVCLASSAEAKKMLQEGNIRICGSKVEVRPYKAITKKERERQIDTNKRSVFLGGLPSSVTVQMLKASIEKLGMKMTNRPLKKAGFIPKVTLATVEQAQNLVARATLDINGATVSVRTYERKNQPS